MKAAQTFSCWIYNSLYWFVTYWTHWGIILKIKQIQETSMFSLTAGWDAWESVDFVLQFFGVDMWSRTPWVTPTQNTILMKIMKIYRSARSRVKYLCEVSSCQNWDSYCNVQKSRKKLIKICLKSRVFILDLILVSLRLVSISY